MFYNHLEESHAASEMAEMTYRQCGPDNLSQSHKAYLQRKEKTHSHRPVLTLDAHGTAHSGSHLVFNVRDKAVRKMADMDKVNL